MPKSILEILDKIGLKMRAIDGHGTVNCIKQGHVPITGTMKVGEKFTSTFVYTVWLRGKQAAHPEKDCKSTNKKAKSKTN